MTAALATGSVQPLHVFAWIVDSGLRDSLKSLAHAILRRVDRHTWRWPRQKGARGGVTVADLADGAGLSRRHAARCLRTLEELGLVRTTFRPFEVSEYHLVPESWREAAEAHREARSARKAARRARRIERYDAWRRSAKASPQPSAPLPRWAEAHGRRLDTPPETVFELVGGAAATILGEGIDPRAQGGLARPVLKLWDARGRPAARQLLDELDAVARWARDSVHPEAVALRGQARGQAGRDQSRDPRRLCDATQFEGRLQEARRHDGAAAPGPEAASQPLPPDDPIPRAAEAPWVPPGQPPAGRPPDDPASAWRAAIQALRHDAATDRGSIDIFLAPLEPIEARDGVLVLQAPSADCARWAGQHLQRELRALADHMGCPLGLVTRR